MWGGLLAGAALAPVVTRSAESPGSKIFLAVITVFGTATVLSAVGRAVGVRIWEVEARLRLRPLDAALGAVISAGASVIAAWLVATMLSTVPAPAVSRAVQQSKVVRAVDEAMPPAPTVFARIDRLLDPLGFPQVFAGLEPRPAGRVPLPSDPTVRAAAALAQASTVRIEGTGCGGVQEGSGFVAAPGLVVTNAHVVAGTTQTVVEDRAGSHLATTLVFDADLDVAVLSARGLTGPPLMLLPSTVERGTQGAVLGYPGGGPLQVGPAAVLTQRRAVGRDIYGRSLATREIYELRAVVRPGNSGGPVVGPDGTVVGVVFARSSSADDVGYALTSTEVRPKLDAARRGEAVDNGPCAA